MREIRDLDEARRFLAQGLWLQKIASPRPDTVATALSWAMEIAGAGDPIPPLGFVCDAGNLLFGEVRDPSSHRSAAVPGWPPGLARTYEDYVLGKLDADASMLRAGEALGQTKGRDRARGLAFVIDRFRLRAGFEGVILNPSAIKAALERSPDGFLAEGWESFERDGPMPILVELYHSLVNAVRDSAEALGPEDLFEVEHGSALVAFSQRFALRQVLRSAADFEAHLPRDRPRLVASRAEVPTRVLDEDVYPVGGFSSISTRGSIESLLHSQLAFMEPASAERPDLFDIKFVRDELLYYSRDENQFLRRRRTFVIALSEDLALARTKDPTMPVQRIVLLLGLLVAATRKLLDWLGEDALVFEFLFLQGTEPRTTLDRELELLSMIFREAIASGTVVIDAIPAAGLADHCRSRSRRSLCRLLTIGVADHPLAVESVPLARLVIDRRPLFAERDEPLAASEASDDLDAWRDAIDRLLRAWSA